MEKVGTLIFLAFSFCACHCKQPLIAKVKPSDLGKEQIVFSGVAILGKAIKSTNDNQAYRIVTFQNCKIFKGNLSESDTIRLDYIEATHGWQFYSHYEYIVIAQPSNHLFNGFNTFEPVHAIGLFSHNRKAYNRVLKKWAKRFPK